LSVALRLKRKKVQPKDLVSQELLDKVSPEWWTTEEGCRFLQKQELKQTWVNLLAHLNFDVWFTLTFRDSASSAGLAIARTVRLLKSACKEIHLECNAFIVAEEHRNGTYHAHGLMRVCALSKEFEQDILRHLWQCALDKYGRNSFTPIGKRDAVSHYVAKYLTKNFADYRLVGFKGLRLNSSSVVQDPKLDTRCLGSE
jgi:hypothetical protein